MSDTTPPMRLALVDDHRLFRKGLLSLLDMVCDHCTILFEADNGIDLQKKIDPKNQPDIILMDVNMPGMDGFACVKWLTEKFPKIKVLVVSMIEKEESVVKMLKLGAKGYLSKDVEPKELGEALQAIMNKGFYYTDFITGKLVHSLKHGQKENESGEDANNTFLNSISDREKEFLQFTCSEFTYSEIAEKMFLSPKTIDGYRNSLFDKLGVRSRVALALYAVKHGLFEL